MQQDPPARTMVLLKVCSDRDNIVSLREGAIARFSNYYLRTVVV